MAEYKAAVIGLGLGACRRRAGIFLARWCEEAGRLDGRGFGVRIGAGRFYY